MLSNSIFWANTDQEGTIESSQIYQFNSDNPQINYCCVQGWTGAFGGMGNIDTDPLFVNDANGDYHLLQDSPCIDTGDPNYIAEPDETDLDGNPRVLDGDDDGIPVVDMGAYEFACTYIGDFDSQCDVDMADYAIFALAWLTEDGDLAWNPACDISVPADNSVNMLDLAVFIKYWLAGK